MTTRKYLLGLLALTSITAIASDSCHPKPDSRQPNYVIGYGSLIQTDSRLQQSPSAIHAYPISVRGYKRSWGVHGKIHALTFLTIIKDAKSSMNAVYYPINPVQLKKTGDREMVYCREKVMVHNIQALSPNHAPAGTYWIYVQKNSNTQQPSQTYPVAQPYADIFLDGCLEVSNTYNIPNFAHRCITETSDWPRRPSEWKKNRGHYWKPYQVKSTTAIDNPLKRNQEAEAIRLDPPHKAGT